MCDLCGREGEEDMYFKTYIGPTLAFIECAECHDIIDDMDDVDPPPGWGTEEEEGDRGIRKND